MSSEGTPPDADWLASCSGGGVSGEQEKGRGEEQGLACLPASPSHPGSRENLDHSSRAPGEPAS